MGLKFPKPQSRAAEKQKKDREQDAAYWKVRKQVLERDSWRCRCCGTQQRVEAHHVRFRSLGGLDTTANMAALCAVCHADVHAYRLFIYGASANRKLRFERVS